ncbi:MAG: type II toxin-antitoxin system Phd/YefM family antitoxin [Myxococcales bacterium]|nr:type II toxin-antitoxin system Phd/YefM family antitoxin [Myxococcales bacterium]
MKTAKIAELKAHLSQYLKLVKKGQRVLVLERNAPVAELVPYRPPPKVVFARLAAEGKCKLGAQNLAALTFTPLERPLTAREVDAVVSAVKGDR